MAAPIPSQPRSINIENLKTHILQVISRELESDPRTEGDRHATVVQLINQAFLILNTTSRRLSKIKLPMISWMKCWALVLCNLSWMILKFQK